MRVTTGMMLGSYLKNLNNNLSGLSRLQKQLAAGKRITKPSDDPIGVISGMQTRVKLYKSDQYKKNVEKALTWLEQTESSVLELNEMIKAAYEKTVNMASDTMSAEDKEATAQFIGQLRDHMISIGNTKSGDKYIFGGHNVNSTPFLADGTGGILYNGLDLTDAQDAALIAEDQAAIEYEIGFDASMSISTTGTQLFGMGGNNVYSVLNGLYDALMADAPAHEVSAFITKLQNCQTNTLSVAASIGGRVSRLELIQNRFETNILMYTALQSKIEDIDLAQVTMNYKMAEAVYTASLQIGAQIIQPSLVNFLN